MPIRSLPPSSDVSPHCQCDQRKSSESATRKPSNGRTTLLADVPGFKAAARDDPEENRPATPCHHIRRAAKRHENAATRVPLHHPPDRTEMQPAFPKRYAGLVRVWRFFNGLAGDTVQYAHRRRFSNDPGQGEARSKNASALRGAPGSPISALLLVDDRLRGISSLRQLAPSLVAP